VVGIGATSQCAAGGVPPAQVLTGATKLRIQLRALPSTERTGKLRLRLRYQPCNDKVCLQPEEQLLVASFGGP
jgi:hypothetical protein